jgi:hypothetical protein
MSMPTWDASMVVRSMIARRPPLSSMPTAHPERKESINSNVKMYACDAAIHEAPWPKTLTPCNLIAPVAGPVAI